MCSVRKPPQRSHLSMPCYKQLSVACRWWSPRQPCYTHRMVASSLLSVWLLDGVRVERSLLHLHFRVAAQIEVKALCLDGCTTLQHICYLIQSEKIRCSKRQFRLDTGASYKSRYLSLLLCSLSSRNLSGPLKPKRQSSGEVAGTITAVDAAMPFATVRFLQDN